MINHLNRRSVVIFLLSTIAIIGFLLFDSNFIVEMLSPEINKILFYLSGIFLIGMFAGYFNPSDFITAPLGLFMGQAIWLFLLSPEALRHDSLSPIAMVLGLPFVFLATFIPSLLGIWLGRTMRSFARTA